jgi:uncharacterized protein HemX
MISIPELVGDAVTIAGTSIVGVCIVQDIVPSHAQEWTAMALLAAITLGIGGWMVKTLDKVGERTSTAIENNTAAQNSVANAMALLTQRETDAQRATEQKRAEIMAKLDHLTEHVRGIQR